MAAALLSRMLSSLALLVVVAATEEVLKNGGFESLSHWDCSGFNCFLTNDSHSGQYAVIVTDRTSPGDGPGQTVNARPGHTYHVGAWARMTTDHSDNDLEIQMDFLHQDGTTTYSPAAVHMYSKTSGDWFHMEGTFTVPNKPMREVRLHFEKGPALDNFVVDDVTCTEVTGTGPVTTVTLNKAIDQHRKTDIHFHITTASDINRDDVMIHVVQTKKSFPFGTAVNAYKYNANAAGGKYRDFIHTHFNWVVPENALDWAVIEPEQGVKNVQTALDMINGVRNYGLKARGRSLVWSWGHNVQDWLQRLYGDSLRTAVRQHIQDTLTSTRGLVEQWDVSQDSLFNTWYQDRLADPLAETELFREAHSADPSLQLFCKVQQLADNGAFLYVYLEKIRKILAANVGLYGIAVELTYYDLTDIDASAITARLNILAQTGIPIWVTKLEVISSDENKRADFYEAALRALYGHPAVEGILFGGFWDRARDGDSEASLVEGDRFELNPAGRRVLDLLENQWMTDVTLTLTQTGNNFTVRGFHGDYEVHVIYQGRNSGT